jgi:hypothetical protein
VIGRACQTHAKAEIDLPLRRDIQINRGENLVLLLRDRIESGDLADRPAIFEARGDLGSEVVAELEVWRKDRRWWFQR